MFPIFLNLLTKNDIFIIIEANVVQNDFDKYEKYFSRHKLSWNCAVKNSRLW